MKSVKKPMTKVSNGFWARQRSNIISCVFNVLRGERDRIRTCDPLIKSQLLYRLSYAPTRAGP